MSPPGLASRRSISSRPGCSPTALRPGTRTIGARTEHFRIARATNGGSHAVVDWVEHLGDQNHLHISVGGQKLVTLVEAGAELEAGDAVSVELIAPLFFDQAGQRVAGRP